MSLADKLNQAGWAFDKSFKTSMPLGEIAKFLKESGYCKTVKVKDNTLHARDKFFQTLYIVIANDSGTIRSTSKKESDAKAILAKIAK